MVWFPMQPAAAPSTWQLPGAAGTGRLPPAPLQRDARVPEEGRGWQSPLAAAPAPSRVTLAPRRCSWAQLRPLGTTYLLHQPWAVAPAAPFIAIPSGSAACGRAPAPLPAPGSSPARGPPLIAGEPCKQPPAARTETQPVLRTLLHCRGCSDPSPLRPGPRSQVPVRAPVLMPALGCCVCAMEAGSCWRLPAPCEVQPGVGTPGRPVTSGDKSTVWGWRGEGVWQQPAASSGKGLGGMGGSCTHPGVVGMFGCSHLPGLHSAAAVAKPLRCPCRGGTQPVAWPRTGNTASRGEGGLESLYPV